jgi:peptidoglycan/xylan/chitin deacetylase (PgdA/CDA1 family)
MTALPLEQARAELLRGHAAVRSAVPDMAALFRFPYLDKNDALEIMVATEGFRTFSCDVIVGDWECKTAEETLVRALSALDTAGNGIVLLHDIHRHTADALPLLLTALAERGYTVVTPVVGPHMVDRQLRTAELATGAPAA